MSFYGIITTWLGMILVMTGLIMLLFRGVPARLHDIFFSIAAIINGMILIFQGGRLEPLLQFSQLILIIVSIFYTWESIQIRRSNRP